MRHFILWPQSTAIEVSYAIEFHRVSNGLGKEVNSKNNISFLQIHIDRICHYRDCCNRGSHSCCIGTVSIRTTGSNQVTGQRPLLFVHIAEWFVARSDGPPCLLKQPHVP